MKGLGERCSIANPRHRADPRPPRGVKSRMQNSAAENLETIEGSFHLESARMLHVLSNKFNASLLIPDYPLFPSPPKAQSRVLRTNKLSFYGGLISLVSVSRMIYPSLLTRH